MRRAPDLRRVAAVSGAAVLLSGLNPNGFGVLATLLDYRRSALTATLIEWSRPALWGEPYAFDVLLYASALALVLSWRRVRPADWLLFVAFAAAALTAFRNEMLVGIAAPILIATYFPWKRAAPSSGRFASAARFAALAHLAAVAALAVTLGVGVARGGFFRFGAAEWRYPAGAASFLEDHRISAPLFNTYEYGGYLIWRGAPVFIDGRALSETVFRDYRTILNAPPGDAARWGLLERYGIGAVLMNAFEYNTGALYGLALALTQPGGAEWKLVYEDAQAMVFLRDAPAGMPVLDKRRILDHLEGECELHVTRDPEFSLCARTLGDLFLRAGDNTRARRALSLYLEHPYLGTPDPEARRAYLQLVSR